MTLADLFIPISRCQDGEGEGWGRRPHVGGVHRYWRVLNDLLYIYIDEGIWICFADAYNFRYLRPNLHVLNLKLYYLVCVFVFCPHYC